MSQQIHEHMRSMFGNYISWFAFFVTINFVVAGWFAGKVLSRKPSSALGVLVTSGYFLVQGILSTSGTLILRSWYGRLGQTLLREPDTVSALDKEMVMQIVDNYRILLLLFAVSLVSLVAFWLVLIGAAYHPRSTAAFFGRHSRRNEAEGSD
jgi:hypothetical protein